MEKILEIANKHMFGGCILRKIYQQEILQSIILSSPPISHTSLFCEAEKGKKICSGHKEKFNKLIESLLKELPEIHVEKTEQNGRINLFIKKL